MDLEKLRGCGDLMSGYDYWIESFDVADLKDSSVFGGGIDKDPGFFNAERDRFFDQHVDAVFEEVLADSGVIDRGHRETDRVDLAEELGVVGKRPPLGNDIHGRYKFDVGHLLVDPRMVLAQMSDADYCDFGHRVSKLGP